MFIVVMRQKNASYERRKHYVSRHLDQIIYEILIDEPATEWGLSEIQDKIETYWHIRPYGATLLRHAFNFYQEHHIPLFYKTGFSADTYKLNTQIDSQEWQDFFKPKPKGRPRKYTAADEELDAQP